MQLQVIVAIVVKWCISKVKIIIKETVQRVVKSKYIYRFPPQQSVKEAVQIGYFACSPSPKDLNPKVCSSAAQKEKRIVLQCRTGLLNNNED